MEVGEAKWLIKFYTPKYYRGTSLPKKRKPKQVGVHIMQSLPVQWNFVFVAYWNFFHRNATPSLRAINSIICPRPGTRTFSQFVSYKCRANAETTYFQTEINKITATFSDLLTQKIYTRAIQCMESRTQPVEFASRKSLKNNASFVLCSSFLFQDRLAELIFN